MFRIGFGLRAIPSCTHRGRSKKGPVEGDRRQWRYNQHAQYPNEAWDV
jgi:hypothetical protein